jgi:hypothetical protein
VFYDLKTLSAKRALPHRVYAGQFFSVQWICVNQARLAGWNIQVIDSIGRVEPVLQAEQSNDSESPPKTDDAESAGGRSGRSDWPLDSLNESVSPTRSARSFSRPRQLCASCCQQQRSRLVSRLLRPTRKIYRRPGPINDEFSVWPGGDPDSNSGTASVLRRAQAGSPDAQVGQTGPVSCRGFGCNQAKTWSGGRRVLRASSLAIGRQQKADSLADVCQVRTTDRPSA